MLKISFIFRKTIHQNFKRKIHVESSLSAVMRARLRAKSDIGLVQPNRRKEENFPLPSHPCKAGIGRSRVPRGLLVTPFEQREGIFCPYTLLILRVSISNY